MGAIEAIPTEYRGIRFRSKTEAVVARAFDLVTMRTDGNISCCWEYEPEWSRTKDGWVADFFIATRFYKRGHEYLTIYALIELKPAAPTDTYFDVLAKRFSEIPIGVFPMDKVCMVGSPLTESDRFLTVYENGAWSKPHGWMCFGLYDDILSSARRHRFDLKEAV